MKVIFLKDCEHGKQNQIKEVSDGLAKNMLIAKGFAIQATKENVAALARNQAKELAAKEGILTEIDSKIEKIKGQTIVITKEFSHPYKIQGTITLSEIATEIEKNLGVIVDKKTITAPKINQVGFFDVLINFGYGKRVSFLVQLKKG